MLQVCQSDSSKDWYLHTSTYQDYSGKINFMIDTWTSPAFVTFCVHLEYKGLLLSMPLDVVEVVTSHTGWELAAVFEEMQKEYRVSQKVKGYIDTHPSIWSCLDIECDMW